MAGGVSFQNMDNWKGSSSSKYGLNFKQIVLMHINRCVQNGSVEWHGGYWNESNEDPIKKYYVQNSREVYSNSVKMLRACLLGYFDKKMDEQDKKLKEEYEKRKKEYDEKENTSKFEWFDYKVEWHLRLFEQLIMLSKRLNFFEEHSVEEEL